MITATPSRTAPHLVLALAWCLAWPLTAQQGAAPRPGWLMAGSVERSDTRAPVRGARIAVADEETRAVACAATTDDNGLFTCEGATPGRYIVSASKETFLDGVYAVGTIKTVATPVVASAGARVAGLDIELDPGASISGVVLDARGSPLADVEVYALPAVPFASGAARWLVNPVLTDGAGGYRLHGLKPGDYVVAAVAATGSRPFTQTAARSFYPGTSQPDQASRVSVAGPVSGVDIVMRPATLASIAVTVNAPGVRPSPVRLSIEPLGPARALSLGGLARINREPDNRFTIVGVPPGEYEVIAVAAATTTTSTGGSTRMLAARAPVFVNTEETSVELTLVPGSRAAGRVVLAGAASGDVPSSIVGRLQLSSAARDLPPASNVGTVVYGLSAANLSVPVDSSGRFEIRDVVPGIYGLMPALTERGSSGHWGVLALTQPGRNAGDVSVEVRPGEDVDDLLLVVGRYAELSGTVRGENGDPLLDGLLLLFGEQFEPERPAPQVYVTRPATDGSYVFRRVPPGAYCVVLSASKVLPNWNDPQVVAQLQRASARVTLRDGARVTLTVSGKKWELRMQPLEPVR